MSTAKEIADAIMAEPTRPVEADGLALPFGTRVADLDRHVSDVSAKLGELHVDLQRVIELLTPPAAPPVP